MRAMVASRHATAVITALYGPISCLSLCRSYSSGRSYSGSGGGYSGGSSYSAGPRVGIGTYSAPSLSFAPSFFYPSPFSYGCAIALANSSGDYLSPRCCGAAAGQV